MGDAKQVQILRHGVDRNEWPECGSVCERSCDQHQHSTLACEADLPQDRRETADRANPYAFEDYGTYLKARLLG